jgi:flagellar M-ring protein FliF
MEKLSQIVKNTVEKITNMSIGKKIAFGLLLLGVIVSAILFGSYINNSKYGVLFSNLAPDDGKLVADKLKEKKIDTRIRGNTIYVPRGQVDELRLEMAPSLSNGSKGYELLDSGSGFGMTDEEFKIKKQRVAQGELEKTIKSFPQIENARVHLTPAQDSVFVRDSKPGKAAVYLQLKPGTKLNADQVRAIVALLSGSVDNVPKENVQVIDDKMELLSRDIFNEDRETGSTTLEKQHAIKTDFESKLERAVLDILEPAIGRDRVKVKLNADLDFDSKEKSQIVYDPNKVEVSTHLIRETSNSIGDRPSQSPIDNNMGNTTTDPNTVDTTSSREEQTTNYNVGRTETRIISAPGEVKRITASVIIDGRLDEDIKGELQKAVAAAIGFKQDRGDEISIIGMNFDPTAKDLAKAEIEAMKKQAEAEKKMGLYRNIGYAVAAFIAFIILLIFVKRLSKDKVKEETAGLDVVIGDVIQPKERIQYAPIELEREDEKSHVEKEIKKYAVEKPEQVADIIKSWLTEDER